MKNSKTMMTVVAGGWLALVLGAGAEEPKVVESAMGYAGSDEMKRNLIHVDVLAPMANNGMYGAAYERVFSNTSNFGGPRSFLIAAAHAKEADIRQSSFDELKAKNLNAIGLLYREYAGHWLSGLYSQGGVSYVTGDGQGVKDGQPKKYDVQAGEVQAGLGLQLLLADTIGIDLNITGRFSFGKMKNQATGEDEKDEHLIGLGFAIAGGVVVAF